jgi:formylglycine-generating enzyme required for sulfatase activity
LITYRHCHRSSCCFAALCCVAWSSVVVAADTNDGTVVLRAPGPAELLIRGGNFRMGSTIAEVALAQEECRVLNVGRSCSSALFADELVAHEVLVADFWLDRTEVSHAAYQRCVDAGVCDPPAYPAAFALPADGSADIPVTLVSWYDASEYCRFVGARLPTEAEFERAARGWSARAYPWGNVFNPKLANHGGLSPTPIADVDGFPELAPIGSFVQGRTSEGIVDLAGNVEEWVADWYAPGYPEADVIDPMGPSTGDERVIRGGSYISAPLWLRATARDKDLPSRKKPFRGFRCARTHRPEGPLAPAPPTTP